MRERHKGQPRRARVRRQRRLGSRHAGGQVAHRRAARCPGGERGSHWRHFVQRQKRIPERQPLLGQRAEARALAVHKVHRLARAGQAAAQLRGVKVGNGSGVCGNAGGNARSGDSSGSGRLLRRRRRRVGRRSAAVAQPAGRLRRRRGAQQRRERARRHAGASEGVGVHHAAGEGPAQHGGAEQPVIAIVAVAPRQAQQLSAQGGPSRVAFFRQRRHGGEGVERQARGQRVGRCACKRVGRRRRHHARSGARRRGTAAQPRQRRATGHSLLGGGDGGG